MTDPEASECVKVGVRIRPLNSTERARNESGCCYCEHKTKKIIIEKPGEEKKEFCFDFVYDHDSRQIDVFNEAAKPIIDSVMTGYNGTIFAYGQTGTGKTFTMEGVPEDNDLKGINTRSFERVFEGVNQSAQNVEYLVRASYLEIYLNEIYDLLSKEKREKKELREDKNQGVFVKDLTHFVCKSVEDIMKILKIGAAARKVGATLMNPGSSRSHSILNLKVEMCETDPEGKIEPRYRAGKLNLVDLAGSERQKRTGAAGDRLEEGKAINLSLSALGNVIKALVSGAQHVRFRDSKLTRLLQDSLGGNTKTCMIAAAGPGELSYEETVSTLRYAYRAKSIKNKPTINEDPKDAMLRKYQDEIAALKARLESRGARRTRVPRAPGDPAGPDEDETIVKEEVEEVVEVQDTGISEEVLKNIQERSLEEQEALRKIALEDKKAMVAQKRLAEKKAKEAADIVKKTEEELEKERKDREMLDKIIKDREEMLLQGKQKVNEAKMNREALKKADEELKARQVERERLEKEARDAEEANLYMNEQYGSRQEELKQKSLKLKQLFARYKEKKTEFTEMQEEWETEKEDLLEAVRVLDREIKYKNMIIDYFIPQQHQERLDQEAHWDAFNEEWSVPGLEYSVNNLKLKQGDNFLPPRQDVSFQRLPLSEAHLARFGVSLPGRGFSPHQQELTPDMAQALQAALNADPMAPLPPEDVYFTYGVEMQKDPSKGGAAGTKAKRN